MAVGLSDVPADCTTCPAGHTTRHRIAHYLHIPVYQGKPNRGAGTPVVSRSVPEHAIHAIVSGTAYHDVVNRCLPQFDSRCPSKLSRDVAFMTHVFAAEAMVSM